MTTDLPLFPTDAELEHLAEYLTDRGWRCIRPDVARTWPVSTVPEEELTHARARRDDHATSKAAAAAVAPRAGSQRARLLAVYAQPWMGGEWTDEEAAQRAGLLGSCYWKRCGELRDGGWLEVVAVNGQEVTRTGAAGSPRIVCRITPAGRALHATLNP
mgnify:CR=1 FL=1